MNNNNAAFGQYIRSMSRQVNLIAEDLGSEAAVICYRANGVPFIYGRPSFVEVLARFLNNQDEAPIVAIHKALALVQLEHLNEVEIGVLVNRLNGLIEDILTRLAA